MMMRTTLPLMAAICSCLLARHSAAQGNPQTTSAPTPANTAIELSAPIEDAGRSEPTAESNPEAAQALGTPNGLFSARPIKEPTAEAAGSGALSAIDPRENGIARVIASLGVVLALLWGLRRVLRRHSMAGGAGRPSGVLEILARYPVARGQQLILLKLARRILLVHQNGSAMTPLAEVNDPDEVASLLARVEAGSTGATAAKFRRMLDSFKREHDDADSRPQPSSPIVRGPVIDLTRKQPLRTGGSTTNRRWRLTA
jgi:flagellar biogenesis protein FliO